MTNAFTGGNIAVHKGATTPRPRKIQPYHKFKIVKWIISGNVEIGRILGLDAPSAINLSGSFAALSSDSRTLHRSRVNSSLFVVKDATQDPGLQLPRQTNGRGQ